MLSRSLGHRAPLLWIVLPLSAGLVVGRVGEFTRPGALLAAAAVAAVVAIAAGWTKQHGRIWGAAMIVGLVCAGAASYALHQRRLAAWAGLPPREIRLALRVERTFAPSDPAKASGLGRITRVDGPNQELTGQRVYFSCYVRPREATPRRSAIVQLTGVLNPLPPSPAADSFDGYLASAGANFRLLRGRVLREERPQLAYYRFCDTAERRFKAILGEGIADKRPALTGLLRAMMLGETRELTEEQHTLFMQSGTMHLFAISGLNIGVIAAALEAILLLVRLPPWVRLVVGAPLLWLFVDITGAAPSAVRAFAMAVFFKAAYVMRRPANLLASVVGSAAVVLVIAPLQLFSASFVMSYGIVLALFVLGLPLAEAWGEKMRLWRDLPAATWSPAQREIARTWNWIVAAVAIGAATTLVSLITSVQYFQLLTPGALVANLVLMPAAMWVTVGGFAALLAGLLGFTAGAALFNHASALVLWAIEALVRLGVRVPGAFIAAKFRAPWVGGVALTLLLAALLYGYGAGWAKQRGGWWPPVAIVAIVLIFGVRFGR